MDIVKELVRIHNEEEHRERELSGDKVVEYFKELFKKRRVITSVRNGRVIGYIESWRVTPAQLIKIKRGDKFHIADEDITKGRICYIANAWIDKKHRNNGVLDTLALKLVSQNKGCIEYRWHRKKKNKEYLKVIKFI